MNRIGMNMERVKKQNRALILNYINAKGPVSRKDIAEATGLTAAAVTQITAALISEGVLAEAGTVRDNAGAAGRSKVLLDIDPESSLVLTINIEPDETTVAVCGLKGEVVMDRKRGGEPLISRFPTDRTVEPVELLTQAAVACNALGKSLPARLSKRLDCVSVGITGIVDTVNGQSVHAYGIWDEPVDVCSILERELGYPVIIENNVDAFSAAELLYGSGHTGMDFLTVKWGPGIGGTVMIDGNIYKGRHGKSAEVGHLIVEPGGIPCVCGRRGCLETRASYKALSAIMPFEGQGDFDEAWDAASPETKEKIDEAIDLLARTIVNSGTLMAPGRVVLFGSLAGIPSLREKLIEACSAYDPAYDKSRVVYTKLAGREGYAGPAAVYAKSRLFTG